MCKECWINAGSPRIVTPKTVACAKAIDAVYEFSCVGGNLHIAVYDWNLDDENLHWIETNGIPTNIHEADEEQLVAERECLRQLMALTLEERYSAMAIHDELIPLVRLGGGGGHDLRT